MSDSSQANSGVSSSSPAATTPTSPLTGSATLVQAPTPIPMNRQIVCFIDGENEAGENSQIEHWDVLELLQELNKIQSPRENTQIDFLLNSPGGSANAAFKLAGLLRSRCRMLNVVIPYYAKSAATLLCLCADKLYMSEIADLGPLDAQLEHPRLEGSNLSALDGVQPLEFFQTFTQNMAVNKLGATIRNTVGLPRKESVELALDFVAKFVQPIISQLEPLTINMCYRNLLLAERYGNELLTKHMFHGDTHAAEKAAYAVRHLVWEYPEHGYAIRVDEAQRIGLNVEKAEILNEWQAFWDYYREKVSDGGKHIHLITQEILGATGTPSTIGN